MRGWYTFFRLRIFLNGNTYCIIWLFGVVIHTDWVYFLIKFFTQMEIGTIVTSTISPYIYNTPVVGRESCRLSLLSEIFRIKNAIRFFMYRWSLKLKRGRDICGSPKSIWISQSHSFSWAFMPKTQEQFCRSCLVYFRYV